MLNARNVVTILQASNVAKCKCKCSKGSTLNYEVFVLYREKYPRSRSHSDIKFTLHFCMVTLEFQIGHSAMLNVQSPKSVEDIPVMTSLALFISGLMFICPTNLPDLEVSFSVIYEQNDGINKTALIRYSLV